ncbi:tetratricopeptide repeat protein [Nonomuraea longicatena]|uniref:Tetratricopeptide repeat protein n=1 Tax=Nonomuraea longicatena TaxID=83682 RepID=A0ABP3Z4U0_9ACTN
MRRKIGRSPNLPPDSHLTQVLLAMAADIADTGAGAETLVECAETLLVGGSTTEALDWFTLVLEGGEPEWAPYVAARLGEVLAADFPETAQAAWAHAAANAQGRLAGLARLRLDELAASGLPPREVPVTVDEVIGRVALNRSWYALTAQAPAEAVEAGELALEYVPEDLVPLALLSLGSALAAAGEPDRAIEVLERLLATGDEEMAAKAALELAGIRRGLGQPEEAIDALRRGGRGEGPFPSLTEVQAAVILAENLGRLDEGISVLRRQALSPIPLVAASAQFGLGRQLQRNGDPDGARRAYRQALDLREESVSGRAAHDLAGMLLGQGDLDGADQVLVLALTVGTDEERATARKMLLGIRWRVQPGEQDPDLVGRWALDAADRFREEGDLRGVMRSNERAMDTGHPLHAPAGAAGVAVLFHADSGMAAAQTAIERLEQVGHAALMPRAWFLFGALRIRDRDFDAAADAWRRVPDTARDAHAAAGCLLRAKHGQSFQAEAAFRQVLRLSADLAPSVVRAVHLLGRVLAERGEHHIAQETAASSRRMAALTGDPGLMTLVGAR